VIIYQGEPAVLTMVRDITERKRAEQERLAHLRMLEALDQVNRAIGGTDDLDQMMSDVLDATLAIFGADRAWLQYPCDPDAPFWQVAMQRTVPEYPSPNILGVDYPKTPIGAKLMRMFLESEGPHILDPATGNYISKDFAKKYGFQTQLSMAIYPKVGPPWLFGLHQCSHPRVWTDEDKSILKQIGRRMADSLTSLLTRRDLVESEEKFRELVERAQDGIVIVHREVVEYINPAYARLMGYEPQELIGRPYTFLIDPLEKEKIEERYRHRMARKNVPHIYETRLVHKDGRLIDVEFNAGIFNYMGEPANLTIVRDITDRKRAEQDRLAHLRMLEALDRINRAIGGTDDLDQMMADVLDATLAIFEADRSWLLVPCDPESPTWRVPMQRTVPEYPGVAVQGVDQPMEPGLAQVQRQLLESEAPIRLVPSFDGPLAEAEARPHGFLSNMTMAIHPKVGPPWMFGLHQCSHPREWTDEELRIFQQIGRRMADALTSLLTRRDLKKSEEKYRDLIEQEKDIIYSLDSDGHINFASPAVTEILGYLPDELIGRHFLDLIPEHWRQKTEADFEHLLEVGEITTETILLDKESRPHTFEYSSTVVRDGGQLVGTRGIARDVTQRKRAEEALQESEEKYRLLFDSADVLVSVYDRDGICQLMNKRVAALFGGEPEDFIGKSFMELHPDASDEYLRRIRETIDSGISGDYEDEVHFPHGTRWLLSRSQPVPDAQGVVKTAQVISQDVTERRQAEQALRESEEKFRELVERAEDGIVILHQGRFAYLNPAHAKLTGYQAEELLGRSFIPVVHPEERDGLQDQHRRRMAGEDVPAIYETRLIHKDGRVVDVEFNTVTINYKGQLANLAMVRDITGRKRAEQERLAHLRMLEALDEINRAIAGTDDLDQMMADVLDAALSILGADRAWLMYPCDPDAPTWKVPKERTVPEYPSLVRQGAEIPMDPTLADDIKLFLNSEEPLSIGPGCDLPLREEFTEAHQLKSALAMVIYPKVGSPWMFGVHQCSHPRVWTSEEKRILHQTGQRIADALTSLLTRRELRDSEKKFRQLVEMAQDGIVIIQQARVAYINPACARLTGHVPEELVGQDFTAVFDPRDRDAILDRYRRRVAGEDVPHVYEARLIHKDGRVIDVEFNVGTIVYQGESATLTIIRDIAERERAERAL
jgi:PAS domain S-box-containing protein